MTFERIAWPRRTERLLFRPATVADLEVLGPIQNLPEVAYWLPSAPGSQADYLLRMGSAGLLPHTVHVYLVTISGACGQLDARVGLHLS